MKIIVCGAGNVGKSIVSYLALGNNDIVVIDKDANNLNAIAKEFDILPILGSSSHPSVLEKAMSSNVDMIIAVTGEDEVNMVTCEIASTIFNIPKKIARIDNQDYLNPIWGGLFNDRNIPIDLVISPKVEIAKVIASLLKFPGMSSVTPLLQNNLYIFAVRCQQQSKLNDISIMQIEHIQADTQIQTICVIHNGHSFIPSPEYKLKAGDIIYFLTPVKNSENIIHSLGIEKSVIEKVLIFGGNEISRNLATQLEQDDNITSCRIIDEDKANAYRLAKELKETAIINGDMMSDAILEEAGIDASDISIAVTSNDKDNLLLSLLAKQYKVPMSISLVNSTTYNNFVENLTDSIIIDRSAVIISSILQELRKARIVDAYSLGRNFGEIWEIEINEYNLNLGVKIKDIDLPALSKICAIYRNNELIFPDNNTILMENDHIVLYVGAKGIKKAEKLFA